MIGRLTPDLTAYLEPEVLEAGGTHELVTDTGFNDCLYLPAETIAAWNLPFVISTPVSYADGSTIITDLYEAHVLWFGAVKRVSVVAGPAGCEALLGMGLLIGHRIELDDRQGEVRISKL